MQQDRIQEVQKFLEQLTSKRFTGFVQFFLKDGGIQREVVQQERIAL